MSSGIVMNGPTPIMLIMFSAVACSRPKRRCRGAADGAVGVVGVVMVDVNRSPVLGASGPVNSTSLCSSLRDHDDDFPA